MRTQTIAGLFDGQEWLAEPVDPTGWLAAPKVTGNVAEDGSADGQQSATSEPHAAVRRAEPLSHVKSPDRAVRRSGRVRHLRRVRTRNLRSGLSGAGSDVVPRTVDSEGVEPLESPAPAPSEGYRLGRWARLTLTVTVLAAVVVVVVSLTAGSAARSLVDVTVVPGDTLWSIAEAAAPDRDPRAVIEEIRQLNDMQGGVLPVGVVLRVPVSVN